MAVRHNAELFGQYLDASSVRTGMNVYAHDGEILGVVREVWADVPEYGYVAKSRFVVADYGPVRGTAHHLDGADAYLQVMPRRGIRAENEIDLYIPLEAVRDIVRDEALIVAHAKADALDRFDRRPACLNQAVS